MENPSPSKLSGAEEEGVYKTRLASFPKRDDIPNDQDVKGHINRAGRKRTWRNACAMCRTAGIKPERFCSSVSHAF